MRSRIVSIAFAGVVTLAACGAGDERPDRAAAQATERETMRSEAENPIRGRTIRWTWVDGRPPAGDETGGEPAGPPTHEHTFHEDGTVTWRVISGPQEGHTATEDEYAALRLGPDVYAVSYLAASGYTLTAMLDFRTNRLVGFASGASEWFPGHGTFEVVED